MLDTYSDFSASSLNPAFYAQPLQRAGLITPGGAAKNGRAVGLEMRQTLLRLLSGGVEEKGAEQPENPAPPDDPEVPEPDAPEQNEKEADEHEQA